MTTSTHRSSRSSAGPRSRSPLVRARCARLASIAACCLLVPIGWLPTTSALAEQADRDKPVHIEADRITVDDRNKVQILEGKVVLTQGTMILRSDKIVVTQDVEGFQKGIAYSGPGGLARFRQKREGKDEYMEGEAERIEHDARTEKTEFFIRAYVKNGQDEVRGQYISFDGLKENYVATSGPNATSAADTGGRVRAVIQPKNKDTPSKSEAAGRTGAPAVTLRPSPDIVKPRQE